MRKYILLAAGLAGLLGCAAPSFAAGWALTADAPLSYTFDKPNANQSPSGPSQEATWDHRSTSDVSGSKVLLIAPFHLGAGYEDYSVAQTITIPCGGGGGCSPAGKVNINFQIVDIVLDIPMRYLNLGLGYGVGQANIDILSGGSTIGIHHADVSQTFVTLGIPLGGHWDLHAGYHWVSVEKKDFLTGGGGPNLPNQIEASGEMLSAGLRLNF